MIHIAVAIRSSLELNNYCGIMTLTVLPAGFTVCLWMFSPLHALVRGLKTSGFLHTSR